MSAANRASIVAAIGATGSGKSAWIKQGIARAKPKRLLIWDPQGEYGEFGDVYSDRAALLDHVAHAKAFRVVYRPGDKLSTYKPRFAWFCKLAYALGNATVILEELADVTEPSWAPDDWSVITRKGRHKGLRVIAASQRPASVDKDFFGNCTLIHCGRLNYGGDVKCMARVLGVPDAELLALPELAYIERDMQSGELRRDALALRSGNA